jgi:SAM-dependent methyltransferase
MTEYSGVRFNFKRMVVDHMFGIRKLVWPVLDLGDLVYRTCVGRGAYPPLSARQKVGGSIWASIAQFDAVGRDSVRVLRELTGLQPEHSVLDIGCGCGRMAIPLLEYLERTSKYYGGDVDSQMIQWCGARITPRAPNATFFHIDVFNSFYNPQLTKAAKDYKFPLPDASVDRIFLGSVFTHMMPEDVEAYLREMARVLTPSGCVLISFFLLNDRRLNGPTRPLVERKFPYPKGRHRLASEKFPELDIAYDESLVNEMIQRSGLQYRRPVLWGSWTGESGFSGHDFAVLERQR